MFCYPIFWTLGPRMGFSMGGAVAGLNDRFGLLVEENMLLYASFLRNLCSFFEEKNIPIFLPFSIFFGLGSLYLFSKVLNVSMLSWLSVNQWNMLIKRERLFYDTGRVWFYPIICKTRQNASMFRDLLMHFDAPQVLLLKKYGTFWSLNGPFFEKNWSHFGPFQGLFTCGTTGIAHLCNA